METSKSVFENSVFMQINFPVDCKCDTIGSNGVSCSDIGQCSCKAEYGGIKCHLCKDGYYRSPNQECIGKLLSSNFIKFDKFLKLVQYYRN